MARERYVFPRRSYLVKPMFQTKHDVLRPPFQQRKLISATFCADVSVSPVIEHFGLCSQIRHFVREQIFFFFTAGNSRRISLRRIFSSPLCNNCLWKSDSTIVYTQLCYINSRAREMMCLRTINKISTFWRFRSEKETPILNTDVHDGRRSVLIIASRTRRSPSLTLIIG